MFHSLAGHLPYSTYSSAQRGGRPNLHTWLRTRSFQFSALVLASLLIGAVLIVLNHATTPKRAYDTVPTAPTVTSSICANPTYLASPYTYTSGTGPYRSGTSGLPTFGIAGSDFPYDTIGMVVEPGSINLADYSAAHTLYYFEPGRYNVTSAGSPGTATTYVGGYANGKYAVFDGGRTQQFAWTGSDYGGVTIEYLAVQDFMPPGQQAVVNDGGSGNNRWVLEHDTFQNNGDVLDSKDGAAAGMGAHDTYKDNCFTHNGQYAVNAAQGGGANDTFIDAVMDNNEISYNGISYYPDNHGCGCSGGVKFWQSWNVQFVGNYVHNNYLAGVWFDTNNTGMRVQDNYFADNYAFAISVELGYNGDITDNTLIDNGIGSTSSAIYLNQSGGDSGQTGSNYLGTFSVSDNTLINNWSGIQLFDNTGRYCAGQGGDGQCDLQPEVWPQAFPAASTTASGGLSGGTLPITSTSGFTSPGWVEVRTSFGPSMYSYSGKGSGVLTGLSLVNGAGAPANGDSVTQITGCQAAYGLPDTAKPPGSSRSYWSLCTWKTKNVTVSGNTVSFNPATVQSMTATSCDTADNCGLNGEWAFISGGGWSYSLSPLQAPVNVDTFKGTQTLALQSTANIYQSVGWVSVDTSNGYAYLSYHGVSRNDLDNVALLTSQGVQSGTLDVVSTTSSAALTAGPPITALPVIATNGPIPDGATVAITSGGRTQDWTLTATAPQGATSLNVASQAPNYDYPGRSSVTYADGGGITNEGCTGGGPAFNCNNQAAYQIQAGANNVWTRNSYYGPQNFWAFPWSNQQGTATTWATWSGTAAQCAYPNSCDGPYGADVGGSYTRSGGPYWNYPAGNPTGVNHRKSALPAWIGPPTSSCFLGTRSCYLRQVHFDGATAATTAF